MSSNPYQAEPQRIATGQKKDNTWTIILIVVGVLLLLTLLTCGGLAVFGFVAAKRAMNEFTEMFAAQMQEMHQEWALSAAEQFIATDEVQEVLGTVTQRQVTSQAPRFDFDEEADDLFANPIQDFRVRVVGTKASGTLVISNDEEHGQLIGSLTLDDGTTIDLPPQSALDFDTDFESVRDDMNEETEVHSNRSNDGY